VKSINTGNEPFAKHSTHIEKRTLEPKLGESGVSGSFGLCFSRLWIKPERLEKRKKNSTYYPENLPGGWGVFIAGPLRSSPLPDESELSELL